MLYPETVERRERTREYVVHHKIVTGRMPTYRVIQAAVGHSSTSLVMRDLNSLSRCPDGLIEFEPVDGTARRRLVLRQIPPHHMTIIRLLHEIMALAAIDADIAALTRAIVCQGILVNC